MDVTRCKEKVYGRKRYDQFYGHQCQKKIWKDGFCKQHHPDSIKEREVLSTQKYQEGLANTPLARAYARIKELEREIRLMKGEE
jgi:hypothetical protein